jgi:hypothetical protein
MVVLLDQFLFYLLFFVDEVWVRHEIFLKIDGLRNKIRILVKSYPVNVGLIFDQG